MLPDPQILEGGAGGTLVPLGDVPALVAAVGAVLAHPAGQAAQLDRAAARARSHYGVVAMRARTVDLIGRVVLEAHRDGHSPERHSLSRFRSRNTAASTPANRRCRLP